MKQSFFIRNRSNLQDSCNGKSIVLAGNRAMQLTADMAAPFRQESNFWYLTGISEPGWMLYMSASKHYLVMPYKSDAEMLFNGGISAECARDISGVDQVIAYKEYLELIKLDKSEEVYTLEPDPHEKYVSFELNPARSELYRQLKDDFKKVSNCRPILAKMRSIKQPDEITAIEKAINITITAFNKVRSNISNYKYEYEIDADITHHLRRSNSIHAYDPIIASKGNACTLHYISNSSPISKGDLVLIDAGAYVGGYAADITRTFGIGAVEGFSGDVHREVEAAQLDIVDLLKPGLSVRTYHEQVDERMKQAIVNLGLMKDINDIANYRRYFPHAISHGLGIDVHDTLGGAEQFEPGMVITVEPGIYVPEKNIGVRIEDDILITEDGYRNLSAALDTAL